MLIDQDTLNGKWLCWIPDTPVAMYYCSKKPAVTLMEKVNEGLENGTLYIDQTTGSLKKV